MRLALVMVLSWLVSTVYAAPAGFAPEALAQIRREVGLQCRVEPLDVELRLIGNTGFRIERWRVRTCSGLADFDVTYFPRLHFPDRVSEFDVRQVGGFMPEGAAPAFGTMEPPRAQFPSLGDSPSR